LPDHAATVREALLNRPHSHTTPWNEAVAALDALVAERDEAREHVRSLLYDKDEDVERIVARAEAAEAEAKKWKEEYEWVGEINKALMPYQDRAVAAEAELERALAELSRLRRALI
jgi:peptidoglycan hydrolase CwlO-like protein